MRWQGRWQSPCREGLQQGYFYEGVFGAKQIQKLENQGGEEENAPLLGCQEGQLQSVSHHESTARHRSWLGLRPRALCLGNVQLRGLSEPPPAALGALPKVPPGHRAGWGAGDSKCVRASLLTLHGHPTPCASTNTPVTGAKPTPWVRVVHGG